MELILASSRSVVTDGTLLISSRLQQIKEIMTSVKAAKMPYNEYYRFAYGLRLYYSYAIMYLP